MPSVCFAAAFFDVTSTHGSARRRLLFTLAFGTGLALAFLAPRAFAEPAAGTSLALTPAAVPVLTLQKTSEDDGTVEEGTLLKYQFTVKNTGSADLEISQVKPSCGCTVPHWDKVIAPGKEGEIDAEVHTEHFRGAILKHLTVISNDTKQPQVELSLTAQITPLVEITPGPVALMSVENKPATQVFTLERTGGHPMKIITATAMGSFLKTDLTPLPGEGRYKLTVTTTDNVPFGRSPTPILVKTDLPKAADLTLTGGRSLMWTRLETASRTDTIRPGALSQF